MPGMSLHVAQNIPEVILIEGVNFTRSIKIPFLVLEALVVGLKHLFVLVVSIGGHRGYLVLWLVKLLGNQIFMLFAGPLEFVSY